MPSPRYEKPVRVLMHDEMITDFALKPNQIFSSDDAIRWFKTKYDLIKRGTIAAHLVRLSTNNKNRLHYNPREDGTDDAFFQIDGSHFRLYQAATDPMPIREGVVLLPDPDPELPIAYGDKFPYEADLRNYLSKNTGLIERGLKLYESDDITGVEFPVGERFVDILAIDAQGDYVVIELKVSRGYDRVIGQLLRYMAWIATNQAEPDQKVRGIIIAKEVSEDLRLACTLISDVSLFEYSLSVTLRPIEIEPGRKRA